MPSRRALVAYASRFGATAEIAEAIASALRALGLDAEALEASMVERVDDEAVVVLGSAVYLGRWRPEARRFIRRFERDLASRPVWLFSSGPLDRSRDGEDREPPRDVERLSRGIGVRGHEWFGGVLSPEADGVLEWLIIRSGRWGDFRDFERIRGWASMVAASAMAPGEPISIR